MKFISLTPDEFRKFANHHPNKSFMQTPEIAALRAQDGWEVHYVGVEDSDKTIAATMLVGKTTFLGQKLFYAPGGPLVDYEDTKLLRFFVQHLKDYLKKHHAYALHIDPYYELIEHDRNGEVVPGGFNHQKALKNLQTLGFKPIKNSSQPKYLFVMDIKGRTPDKILADFKRNTRNHVRKAEKMGVTIRELEKSDLHLLKQITESTSKRRHFTDRPLSYYEQMYDLFVPRGEAKFILAEAPMDTLSKDLFADGANAERLSPVTTGAKERSEKDVSTVLPLSAAMFLLYGDEIVYLFSGSDEKYMKDYNAQYLIQWYMIRYAAEHGFKRYNFYGINGLPEPNSPDYGIYDFKKGFGGDFGHVVELLGSFELPLSPIYYLHQTVSKVKSLLKP